MTRRAIDLGLDGGAAPPVQPGGRSASGEPVEIGVIQKWGHLGRMLDAWRFQIEAGAMQTFRPRPHLAIQEADQRAAESLGFSGVHQMPRVQGDQFAARKPIGQLPDPILRDLATFTPGDDK